MPLTTLDAKTALVIVDLQKGLLGALPSAVFDGVVEGSRVLAEAFRGRGLLVVLVTVNGVAPGRTEQPGRVLGDLPPDFAEVVEALGRRPDDLLVVKRTAGAFATTDLEQQLKALGVTQVVVTGVATASGVESTARQAYEAGFNVTVVTDAVADPRAEAHAYSLAHVFPRLAETGMTADVLALLKERG